MKEFLTWLANNWSLVVASIAVVCVVATCVYKFISLPNDKQVEKIKKCLLAWVIAAERDLGGGTGRVKLSVVYGCFVQAFPVIKNFIPFEVFSDWVDEALEEMRKMLKENGQLKTVVEGVTLEEVTAEVITKE